MKEQEPTTNHLQEDSQAGPEAQAAETPETPQENSIEAKYAALLEEHEILRDKYLRIYADFDNFKKRTLKERAELMRTASQDTMTALLPVLDDFDRAKQNSAREGSTEVMSEGVLLVYHKLFSTLKGLGLESMATNETVFDPELHEAITEIPAPTEALRGKVVDTIEKGYRLGDRIIRYAKVVVGK
ncbi:MAG: nucleotide exchange factor GrpE [Saprospiraceae bacterium]